MNAKQKVIIDCDPGIDDALALMLALSSPELDVLGITVVCGNVPAKTGVENALRILKWMGRLDIPVYSGETKPLERPYEDATETHGGTGLGNLRYPTVTEVRPREGAVEFLAGTQGNILLTTGSKDLKTFTQVPDYQTRLYVRVLPSLESLSAALDLGYPAAHVICMQGPFPEKLNAALLEAVDAKILVTKDTGKAGGFSEKAAAAKAVGAQLLVIRRPTQETGMTLEALFEYLTKGQDGL